MDSAYLIVGLGNPGREYEHTRHNAGFLLAERFAEKGAGQWKEEKRFASRMAKTVRNGKTVFLCQPLTYMNVSGRAVQAVCQYYRLPLENLLIAVDDADLALGTIRLRPEGSSGGHHGLESIEQHLGSRQFARQRIGIGREDRSRREITGHVLGRFTEGEWDVMNRVLDRACDQAACWLQEGVEKAMNRYNGALAGS